MQDILLAKAPLRRNPQLMEEHNFLYKESCILHLPKTYRANLVYGTNNITQRYEVTTSSPNDQARCIFMGGSPFYIKYLQTNITQ